MWANKRITVTGAGGFIGSHLVEHLAKQGASVQALIHYNALNSHGWLDASEVKNDVEVIAGDISDADSVRRLLQGQDIVFHLAALIGIPYSYVAPVAYVQTNIVGTLNVLQAARQFELERVVHTSTSEVYGTALYTPIDESHPLQGQSPYSATKIAADKLAESYYRSFDVPVVTVRPFNTFGPRQSTRAVIPTIITQCLQGDTIRLGKLTPTRDLNYVQNTVQGFVKAAEAQDVTGEVINIGSGEEISIGDLAQLIAEIMGRKIEIVSDEQRLRPEKSEVDRLLADNSRAREWLGWEPTISLKEGLEHTINWIQQHTERYRPGVYTI